MQLVTQQCAGGRNLVCGMFPWKVFLTPAQVYLVVSLMLLQDSQGVAPLGAFCKRIPCIKIKICELSS